MMPALVTERPRKSGLSSTPGLFDQIRDPTEPDTTPLLLRP